MEEDWQPKAKKGASIIVGEDLSPFAKEELEDRLVKLAEEIERVKTTITARDEQSKMAQNMFKSET
ncbi:MAG: hypothetical protein DHS20C08_12360 [Rhodomicrobium sp.]|nr:MAG: hypothetical protein DHS20C08_12360 [Rhodomicrobium sp.]